MAAAINRSISAVVRYSRLRTEEFTVVGAARPPVRFSTPVSIGAVGAVFVQTETGDIAARPRQTIDEAAADRINHRHEHDRHGASRLLQRLQYQRAADQDDVRLQTPQLRPIGPS